MSIEELNKIWKSTDSELLRTVQVNKVLLKEVITKKMRSALSDVRWENYLEIACSFLLLSILFDYMMALPDLRFMFPAAMLAVLMLASSILCIYKLYLYYSINADKSVIDIQRNAEKLNYWELQDTNSILLAIPLFWLCALIVGADGILGYDLYQHPVFLMRAAVGSFVVALVIFVLLRLFPNKKLKESIEFLKELDE